MEYVNEHFPDPEVEQISNSQSEDVESAADTTSDYEPSSSQLEEEDYATDSEPLYVSIVTLHKEG